MSHFRVHFVAFLLKASAARFNDIDSPAAQILRWTFLLHTLPSDNLNFIHNTYFLLGTEWRIETKVENWVVKI
jgi:hypothetical protein